MKFHRFIIPIDLDKAGVAVTDPRVVHQLRDVLRLKAGESVILANGEGKEAQARIQRIGKSEIVFLIPEIYENTSEPVRSVSLYCAIIKHAHFEMVVEKATEAGVKRIVPIVTARTVKQDANSRRLEAIIREAAEQSGRGVVPELGEVMLFEDAVNEVGVSGKGLFFDIAGTPVRELEGGFAKGDAVSVFIGPEGGWIDEERRAADAEGFAIVSLGKLTYRAETAAIIACWAALNM